MKIRTVFSSSEDVGKYCKERRSRARGMFLTQDTLCMEAARPIQKEEASTK